MILVDTSAWIEYLRATDSAVHTRLRSLVAADEALATTDIVVIEILAGARDPAHVDRLRRLLYRCRLLSARELALYEEAARLYRACCAGGDTVRKLTDCLIAAVALSEDVAILHRDADFETIARHTSLRLA